MTVALSATAAAMMATLPEYYEDNEVVRRILNGAAGEIDRNDAAIDEICLGMIPSTATDTYGLLSVWELTLGLPVRPSGRTVAERQDACCVAFAGLDATSAEAMMAMMAAAAGAPVLVERDTPGSLQDRVTIPAAADTYEGARTAEIVQAGWPAHRQPNIVFDP